MNARIRIAYLVHDFGTGGIERCVVNLVNNMNSEQFEPVIVCLTQSGASANALSGDTQIVEIKKGPGWESGSIRRLASVLREHQIDVLHSHNWGTLIEGTLARRSARVPVHVHTEHGQGLHADVRGGKRLLRKLANRWAFNRLNRLAVCARSVIPLIENRTGFPSSKIKFLPNGVPEPTGAMDGSDRKRLRDELGIAADAIVLGSTGRLVPVKGFELAIQVTAALKGHPQEFHLILVGDGASRADLSQLAKSLGIEKRVHFVGHQNSVGAWLKTFDLFLNTSISEAMSLSVLEAMAVGLPIVAGDVGDNRFIINNDHPCGRICDSRNANDFKQAILAILDSPTAMADCSSNARSVYQSHFSIESMIERHTALYQGLFEAEREDSLFVVRHDRK